MRSERTAVCAAVGRTLHAALRGANKSTVRAALFESFLSTECSSVEAALVAALQATDGAPIDAPFHAAIESPFHAA
jgi:hypothetical protein